MGGVEKPRDASLNEAPMLGDHIAMDLLNTAARNTGGDPVEYWNSGDDVIRWLEQHDILPSAECGEIDSAELLKQAKALRTLAGQLIVQSKEEKTADISDLNRYLHAYRSAPQLDYDIHGKLVLTRTARGEVIASLLGPIAEALAQLLVENKFTLVKQCEHPDCVLWFYDRTKAHKRRWCSMALCGNRYKAAQFRKRSGGETF